MTDEERAWLRAEFERCAPYIQAALDRDELKLFELEDVWDYIADDKAQLWPLPNSVIVTALANFPRKTVLRYWLCGGNLDECVAATGRLVEPWARKAGATIAVIDGRKGWLRALPGYRPQDIFSMTKAL